MRIGLICSGLSADHGWATYSLNLARALRSRDLDVTVVSSRGGSAAEASHAILPALNPPGRHTFIKSMWQAGRLRPLLRDCDIIHCTVEPFAPLAALAAGDRPFFLTAHGSYVNLPRMRKFPMNRVYAAAFRRARLICVSRYTAGVARNLLPGSRIHVVNNGVDISSYMQRPALRVEKRAPTVIAAGGVKPRKGTLQLVEAMARVREVMPRAQCRILGPPQFGSAYTTRLQGRIAALGLQDCVHILGFVDDALKRAWYSAADVMALPAVNDGLYFEGFGLTLIEAGAAGTAVIGTDGCGVADAIEHGLSGLVISQRNISEELPRAILRLLGDAELSRRMGAAGRRRAQQQTWDKVASQVIALYQEALDEPWLGPGLMPSA